MPTVIDALVVSLSLDGSAYEKGVDTAVKGREKVAKADTAGGKATVDAEKRRKDAIAATTKTATDGYRQVAGQLLGVLGILTGIKSVGGFFGGLVTGNVQLAQQAQMLSMSTKQLYAWGKAVDALGGSGDAFKASLGGINDELNELARSGQTGGRLQSMQQLFARAGMNVNLRNSNGSVKSVGDLLPDIQKALGGMSEQQRQSFARSLGIGGAEADIITSPRFQGQYNRALANAPGDGAISASQQMIAELTQIGEAVEKLGNTMLQDLGPDIEAALSKATDWWAKNGQQFTKDFEAFLKTAVTDAESFGKEVDTVVTALGGWKSVSEDLFALWVGGKFLGMLGNVVKLVQLFRALGVGGAAAGAAGAAEAGVAGAGATAVGEGALALGAGAASAAAFPVAVAGAVLYFGNKLFATSDTRLPQSTVDTANPLYQQLIAAGVSPQGASAILGNAMAESSLDPTRVDSTNHAGLFQWSTARRAQIKMHFGKDPLQMTAQEQMTAFLWEAKNNPAYAATNKAIFDPSGSTGETAETINRNFEGSADYSGKRAAFANGFYNRFAGGVTAGRIPTLKTQGQPVVMSRMGGREEALSRRW